MNSKRRAPSNAGYDLAASGLRTVGDREIVPTKPRSWANNLDGLQKFRLIGHRRAGVNRSIYAAFADLIPQSAAERHRIDAAMQDRCR